MPEIDRWENEGGQVNAAKPVARIKALQRRHLQLDSQLDRELTRPNPCSIELQRLRREKLYLKDQIFQISG
ncbi:MAG: YdcH family protein [Henriciella sp.]|nr:YdcH family protein [Henriciella sp.]